MSFIIKNIWIRDMFLKKSENNSAVHKFFSKQNKGMRKNVLLQKNTPSWYRTKKWPTLFIRLFTEIRNVQGEIITIIQRLVCELFGISSILTKTGFCRFIHANRNCCIHRFIVMYCPNDFRFKKWVVQELVIFLPSFFMDSLPWNSNVMKKEWSLSMMCTFPYRLNPIKPY